MRAQRPPAIRRLDVSELSEVPNVEAAVKSLVPTPTSRRAHAGVFVGRDRMWSLPSPRGGVVPVTGFQSARSAFRNARSSDNCRRAATERGADSGATPSVAGTADGGAHDSTIEKPVVRAAAPPKVCRRSIVGRSYG